MTSPIERATRAIKDALMDGLGRGGISYQVGESDDGKQTHEYHGVLFPDEIARAVLEAIREPSEAMADKGGASIAGQFTDPWDVLSPEEEEALGLEVDGDDAYLGANERLAPYASEAWRAMIDAAMQGA